MHILDFNASGLNVPCIFKMFFGITCLKKKAFEEQRSLGCDLLASPTWDHQCEHYFWQHLQPFA